MLEITIDKFELTEGLIDQFKTAMKSFDPEKVQLVSLSNSL